MGSSNIIVREYLESLKEDGELDYLLPILLNQMRFRIVATPKESKGQPQYGKDIVAIGIDDDGDKKRFYFELKGHADKDINDTVLNKKDGIIDSLKAARYTPYCDETIPGFNSLPEKYILVHNGILKSNTRSTFNGFIQEHFPEGSFDRWDIYKLGDLFEKYLFGEYLFTDEISLNLFKKSLVLLDAPNYEYRDFYKLVDIQIEKIANIKNGRVFNKFFATQNLLAHVILKYSKDNSNMEPAKHCLTYLLLSTWAWILRNNVEKKNAVRKAFAKLIEIHYSMLDLYFQRTLRVAKLKNGLFAENGGEFEEIGYPLRSFEYLNYIVYYFQVRLYYPSFDNNISQIKKRNLRRKQKECLIELIQNNDGCKRPVLDHHSIAVLNVVLFFLKEEDLTDRDLYFVTEYLYSVLANIVIIESVRGRFPFIGDEIGLVKELRKEKVKKDIEDSESSLLVTILFELIALLNYNGAYEEFKAGIKGKLNLQVAYPYREQFNIEELLFQKHFHLEFYVETSINLKSTLAEFKEDIVAQELEVIDYRTDKAGFSFLRSLAHIYFKNEYFVDEWRILFRKEKN